MNPQDIFQGTGMGILAVVVLFVLLLVVLWTLLPFAVFGMKPLLHDILVTQTQILAELKRINAPGNNNGGDNGDDPPRHAPSIDAKD